MPRRTQKGNQAKNCNLFQLLDSGRAELSAALEAFGDDPVTFDHDPLYAYNRPKEGRIPENPCPIQPPKSAPPPPPITATLPMPSPPTSPMPKSTSRASNAPSAKSSS